MKHKKYYQKIGKKIIISSYLITFLFSIIFSYNIILTYQNLKFNNANFKSENKNVKSSLLWGWVNFTNPEINGMTYYHGDSVIIKGRLFHYYTNVSYQGYIISIVDNGNLKPSFQDTTNTRGHFEIDYTIPFSGNIYSNHNITVEVTNPGGSIEFLNSIIISYRANSYFDISYPDIPALSGGEMIIDGYIRYDNSSSIPNALVNYYWYDNNFLIDSNSFFTDNQGYISTISVPDIISNRLSVKFNYSSALIDASEKKIGYPKTFSNISCIWDLPETAVEYNRYTIAGYVISRTNNTLMINDRAIRINYNSSYIDTVNTDSNGYFSYTFNLPAGAGLSLIEIELENSIGKYISTFRYITVQTGSPPPNPVNGEIPFLGFFLVFIPILSGIIIGLAGYGYYHYRKQDKLSRVVNLPLESRIANLKILKDSDRLEESISYLFNGIYMELVKAKYGRIRKDNETIRDFAIVSVKDLKLNPTSIYPFIQKIEEIIYARPYQISDKHFYSTIELFSPIYFQLTGYNFELNF